MKVEQLIVQYLYNNKKVSIQDIGIFTISPDIIMPTESDKDINLPDGSIQFEFDSKAEKEDALIDFIIQHSRKIRPLATSDLESYSILSRQFLNIGKPLIIEGLGTLQKNQQGSYDFTQGRTLNPKLEENTVIIKEKIDEEISFSTPSKPANSNKGIMWLIVTLFLLSIAGALYYFLVYNKEKELRLEQTKVIEPVEEPMVNAIDTSNSLLLKTDSLNMIAKIDSAIITTPKDGYSFKIVLKEYPTKAAVDRAFIKLTSYGHKLIVSQKDSTTYKLLMPFTGPISDTLRAKDSLKIFFFGKPYVEL